MSGWSRRTAAVAVMTLASCVAVDGGAPRPAPPAPAPGIHRTRPAPSPAPALPEPAGRLRTLPERLDFEPLEVGESASMSLAIVNEGWGALWIRELSVATSRSFALARDGCSRRTLRPREDCRVEVRFSPREPGRVSGILRVSSNDPGRPAHDVRVSGTGIAPRRPDVYLRPARLEFGAVAVGSDRILDVEVGNAGGAPLRVRASSASGPAFRVVSDLCSRGELRPGTACRIAVRFAPREPGPHAGELRVRTDDPDERETAATLAGNGVPAGARCPQRRLEPLRGERRGGERTYPVSGKLDPGACVALAARVREEGRLLVCVPPGFGFAAPGFGAVPDAVCRPGEDEPPYQAFRSGWIASGTDLDGLVIERGRGAPRDFTVLLRFRPRRAAAGSAGEDD